MLEKLKYPIGKFKKPEHISKEQIKNWIEIIEQHPIKIAALVKGLNTEQLDTAYRPDGWTIRQVLHHLGDSHANSYIRYKWALTEEQPVIKAYYEDRWAELSDTKEGPVDLALNYLTSLHAKWVYLLKSLDEDDFNKSYVHPESGKKVSLAVNTSIYAWHCEHHYEHINQLLIRNQWK